MGITVMPGLTSMESDTRTQRISTTIGQARLNGRFYRHPDSALVSYPVAVDNALGALPDRAYNIAIVGCGAPYIRTSSSERANSRCVGRAQAASASAAHNRTKS